MKSLIETIEYATAVKHQGLRYLRGRISNPAVVAEYKARMSAVGWTGVDLANGSCVALATDHGTFVMGVLVDIDAAEEGAIKTPAAQALLSKVSITAAGKTWIRVEDIPKYLAAWDIPDRDRG